MVEKGHFEQRFREMCDNQQKTAGKDRGTVLRFILILQAQHQIMNTRVLPG